MKKNILLFAFLSILYSCNKDDDTILSHSRGKATFEIGSIEKIFTKLNSFNNGVLVLGNTEDEFVSLFFPKPTTIPTTYDMDTQDIITASYIVNGKTYNATNGIAGIGKKGSLIIEITDYNDSKISGTFEVTAITENNEQIIITQGIFNDIPEL